MARDDDPLKYFPGYAEACAAAEANKGVPGAARPNAEAVPCSAWMDEAGAALTHARNALLIAPAWNENWTAQKEIAIAIRCLETAIASEPRPSSIESSSATGAAEPARPAGEANPPSLFAGVLGSGIPRRREWQCQCGWRVADECYLSIVFDAPCPRCGSKYSTFHSKQMGGDSPNEKLSDCP